MNQKFKDLMMMFSQDTFSLVVTEVYASGSLYVKQVRCPGMSGLAKVQTELHKGDDTLKFNKYELCEVLIKCGIAIEKTPAKQAGSMSHIYYFCPAGEGVGLPLESLFGRDAVYAAMKNSGQALENAATGNQGKDQKYNFFQNAK